ncbi:indole-3-glycerol-phosphate synthase [Streptomyces sp. NPDC050636]|uniref:indole-3-glycerol-phosphate synthase n=1 Tax=Streptomyces sp. NPDC050636 TaxID=3154510 RepID=UPI0034149283
MPSPSADRPDSGLVEGGRFGSALLSAATPVIMELKRHSAHGADLFRGRPVAELVQRYTALGAPALSVVTGSWFGGTQELLDEVAAATRLPILVKDFFTKEKQIARASAAGASAVLLTATVLPRTVLPRLIEACLEHGLTPFVEVTSQDELSSLVHAQACVVAVNNKDIRQRERDPGDLGRSRRLLRPVLATGTAVPVSASGIATPGDAAGLLSEGYRGLLIGTGLLRAADLDAWFGELAVLMSRSQERVTDQRQDSVR